MEKEEKKNSNETKTLKIILFILITLVIIGGSSLALFNFEAIGEGTNKIKSGTISFYYTEPTNAISLTEKSGTPDDVAVTNDKYFEFSCSATATGKTKVSYIVYITPDTENTIDNEAIKVSLSQTNGTNTSIEDETLLVSKSVLDYVPFNISTLSYNENSNNYSIYEDTFDFTTNNVTQTHNYRLRMWVDNEYFNNNLTETNNENVHEVSTIGGTYKLKVNIYALDGEKANIMK